MVHSKKIRFFILFFTTLFLFPACAFSKNVEPFDHSSPLLRQNKTKQKAPPSIGFNSKGTLQTANQVEYAKIVLKNLNSEAISKLHIRVTGGTLSQTTFPNDWSKQQIQSWIELQKAWGFHFVYVVNGNDSPESQRNFIQYWINQGAKFSFIEMMNEYYLPKYRLGRTSKPGVTRKVLPSTYLNEILPAFFEKLSALGLRMFVIFAPKKTVAPGAPNPLRDWNEALFNGMKRFQNISWGAALHLYKRSSSFDYDQINELRDRLPPHTPIAITEAGVLDLAHSYAEASVLASQHYKEISNHLTAKDYLFDHVLYNNTRDLDFVASTHPTYGSSTDKKTKGITPKGLGVIQFFNSLWGP